MASPGYEIIKKLAVGGMAEIFLAKHRSIGGFERLVVLKCVLPTMAKQQDFVDSFLNEARLSAQLSHPNCVSVFDLGQVNDRYYIAMEYLRGFDLGVLLAWARSVGKPLPLAVSLRIFTDICAGLDYAHNATDADGNAMHLVHRDVTPSNVFVTLDGGVKLVDFGIARAKTEPGQRADTLEGKDGYFAPEQLLGEECDHRVDIFASGIVLYQLLSNEHPFREPNIERQQLFMRIVKGQYPPLSRWQPDLAIFDAIIGRMLAVSPKNRPSSAREVLAAVENASRVVHADATQSEVRRFVSEHGTALTRVRDADGPSSAAEEAGSFSWLLRTTRGPRARVGMTSAVVTGVLLALLVAAGFGYRWSVTNNEPATLHTTSAATVQVATQPSGAQVLIDNVLYTGLTPLAVDGFEVGETHTIEAHLAGYQPTRRQLTLVRPGVQAFTLVLRPQSR